MPCAKWGWLVKEKAMKKTRDWRWVTVESHKLVYIWSGENRPINDESWYQEEGSAAPVCRREFNESTGLNLQPGDCVKVKFSAEIVP
jgi:hypothetical protein